MQENNYRPDPKRCITQPFVVVGCLVWKDNKILLIKENGKYNLPQGWLELGETIEGGAKREFEEETGLEIRIEKLRGIYPLIKEKSDKILHAIKIIYNGKLTGNKKEIVKIKPLSYEWLSLEEIQSNNIEFWDLDVVDIINDNNYNNKKKEN